MSRQDIFSASLLVAIHAGCAAGLFLGSENANAQDASRVIAGEAFGKPAATWFDSKSCKLPAGSDLFLSVGKATLKVPVAIVNGAAPGKIDRVTKDPAGKIVMHAPVNLGCPEAPFSISLVRLGPVQAIDAGTIELSWSPENKEALELQLAKIRDSGSCPSVEPGLVYCEGSRTDGSGAREKVGYLMASDSKLLQKSGGPLRARCLFRDEKPFCNVLDDVEGDVRYQLPIVGKPSLALIAQTHAKARAYIDSLRVKSR